MTRASKAVNIQNPERLVTPMHTTVVSDSEYNRGNPEHETTIH